MSELAQNVRKLVIDALNLLASEEKQLKYQKSVPNADVSAELFCQWDSAFIPDSEVNLEAFTKNELDALTAFNKVFEEVCERTPENLPSIEDFIKTEAWSKLQLAAEKTLIKGGFRIHKD